MLIQAIGVGTGWIWVFALLLSMDAGNKGKEQILSVVFSPA